MKEFGGYTVVLQQDDEGDVIACILELNGCLTHGATVEEALTSLAEVMQAWIELADGDRLPEPSDQERTIWSQWKRV